MNNLTAADRQCLEKVFGMGSGYVLDFSDEAFGQFFESFNVDIHGVRYQTHGSSKAKKMRAFWDQESDALVGRVVSEMLKYYEVLCHSVDREPNSVLLEKSREIIARISGMFPDEDFLADEEFLNKAFEIPNLQKLPVDSDVAEIIQDRLKEAQACLSVGAYLSVIILCGSVLEAVLLGAAQKDPAKFNRSAKAPKGRDKPKAFRDWTLLEFINVGCDLELLKPDVREFSQGLREFRNYIHPNKQLKSDFKPDEFTAKICFQVLKAALADVSDER